MIKRCRKHSDCRKYRAIGLACAKRNKTKYYISFFDSSYSQHRIKYGDLNYSVSNYSKYNNEDVSYTTSSYFISIKFDFSCSSIFSFSSDFSYACTNYTNYHHYSNDD